MFELEPLVVLYGDAIREPLTSVQETVAAKGRLKH